MMFNFSFEWLTSIATQWIYWNPNSSSFIRAICFFGEVKWWKHCVHLRAANSQWTFSGFEFFSGSLHRKIFLDQAKYQGIKYKLWPFLVWNVQEVRDIWFCGIYIFWYSIISKAFLFAIILELLASSFPWTVTIYTIYFGIL